MSKNLVFTGGAVLYWSVLVYMRTSILIQISESVTNAVAVRRIEIFALFSTFKKCEEHNSAVSTNFQFFV